MKKVSELSKGENLKYRLAMIEDAVGIIRTDMYFDGKLDKESKSLIKDDLKAIRFLKKGKGYVYG